MPSVEPQRLQRCLTWATQLGSMNGPKVHGSIEKAFITAYLPLCREIASGAAPTEAAAAAERWAEGFAQGYASAFRQLGTGARRPRMVKDVVDVSVRWLGQYRARQCQLLLVSAMRFDLAQRLNEELESRFAAGAVCADQCMLWAALPSNAEAQRLGGQDAGSRRVSAEMRRQHRLGVGPSFPSTSATVGFSGSTTSRPIWSAPARPSPPGSGGSPSSSRTPSSPGCESSRRRR